MFPNHPHILPPIKWNLNTSNYAFHPEIHTPRLFLWAYKTPHWVQISSYLHKQYVLTPIFFLSWVSVFSFHSSCHWKREGKQCAEVLLWCIPNLPMYRGNGINRETEDSHRIPTQNSWIYHEPGNKAKNYSFVGTIIHLSFFLKDENPANALLGWLNQTNTWIFELQS